VAIATLSYPAISAFATEPKEAVRRTGCPRPVYPANAHLNGEEGITVLGLLVRPDGTIEDTRLLSSSGSRDMDLAAKFALSKCVFARRDPGKDEGDRWARIIYTWTLGRGGDMAWAKERAALAVSRGDADARYRLSLLHAATAMTDADREQALLLLRKAAELGHAYAQFDLGERLQKGDGMKADLEEALGWYRKSAAQGNPLAVERMKQLEPSPP
jgi:TonB family protein